jgi:hypothetical protein
MINSLITGIILALLSALAYIAYKFPNTYSFLYHHILWLLIILLFVGSTSYNFAFQLLELNLPYDDNYKLVKEITDSLSIPWLLLYISFVLGYGYFHLLYKMHDIINYFDNSNSKAKEDDEKSDNK